MEVKKQTRNERRCCCPLCDEVHAKIAMSLHFEINHPDYYEKMGYPLCWKQIKKYFEKLLKKEIEETAENIANDENWQSDLHEALKSEE